ncbi:MAG: signal peptidase I [Pseudomonadota bacterium]
MSSVQPVDAADSWWPKLWVTVSLGLLVPPLAYVYLHRLAYAAAALACALFVLLASFHQPWVLWLYPALVALHAGVLVSQLREPLKARWFTSRVGLLVAVYVCVSIVAGIRLFVVEPFSVVSASMVPSLEVGDVVLVRKWGETDIERGSIYTFRFNDSDVVYVKRLIGIPGDTVTMRGNHVVLNGEWITRRAGARGAPDLWERLGSRRYPVLDQFNIKTVFARHFELGPDDYFFLGDNRSNSTDSRLKGAVPSENIIGEVASVIPSPW